VAAALLVALAGGPVSDALFARGGTAGMLRVAWEPVPGELLAFRQAGPALLRIGIVPLAAIGLFAAYRARSWGLGLLATAGALGLLEAELLQSQFAWHEKRIVWLSHAVALIGALAGVGALIGGLSRVRLRLAVAALGLFVLLPSALPVAVLSAHVAFSEVMVAAPLDDDSGHHYRDRTDRVGVTPTGNLGGDSARHPGGTPDAQRDGRGLRSLLGHRGD